MKTVTRWLLLLAMMLTPLAMQPAVAAAAPAHHAMASSSGPHCDPASPSKVHLPGDCSMACASALPVSILSSPDAPAPAALPTGKAPAPHLAGLPPESATPPPRLA